VFFFYASEIVNKKNCPSYPTRIIYITPHGLRSEAKRKDFAGRGLEYVSKTSLILTCKTDEFSFCPFSSFFCWGRGAVVDFRVKDGAEGCKQWYLPHNKQVRENCHQPHPCPA